MKNQAIAYKVLEAKGLQAEEIAPMLEGFMTSAKAETIAPILIDEMRDFLLERLTALEEANKLGMLAPHVEAIMKLADTDGSKTANYMLTNFAPQLMELPGLVEAEKQRLADEAEAEREAEAQALETENNAPEVTE